MKQVAMALCGALVGGTVGYFAFFWMARQGFYALALPGGLVGIGAGITRARSILTPLICGLAAAGLGLVAEWRFAPFADNDSFSYFLAHVHQLNPVTLLMIVVGILVGFWVPFRRMERKLS
jgi:hypothetical protein